MEASADLLVEESVLHRREDVRIYSDSEFSEIASPFVCIQQSVYPVGIVGSSFDYLTVFYFKLYILVGETLLLREGVVAYSSVHGFSDRSSIDFAVGNISEAVAFDSGNIFDRESQVCSGSLDVDSVCAVHQIHQRIHSLAHLLVIESADIEVKSFKGFLRFVGQLSH